MEAQGLNLQHHMLKCDYSVYKQTSWSSGGFA